MERKDGHSGPPRRRGLRRVALAGTTALALAGLAQVTGSAFADTNVGSGGSLTAPELTLANAPAELHDGTPVTIKSVRITDGRVGDGTTGADVGCFSITSGQAPVATGKRVALGHHLLAEFFAAEECTEEIPDGAATTTVTATMTQFVFDLTEEYNRG